jgi:hypothetical protein
LFAQEAADTPSVSLSEALIDALCAHRWPGNLRQLRNALRAMLARRSCDRLDVADLPSDYSLGAQAGEAGTAGGEARSLNALGRAEREALMRLQQSNGQETVHDFTEIDGEPVVRYAQARIMKQSCVDCHNTHPMSSRKNWKVGDVRGVLEIIRPLKNDEARVTQALELTLFLSALGSGLLLLGSVLAVWATRPTRLTSRPTLGSLSLMPLGRRGRAFPT